MPDDLTKLAESESNGSALAAIKLLRSTSNGSILQPSGSKRNATVLKQAQRPHNAKKLKLTKSHSISGLSALEKQALPIKVESAIEEDECTSSKKLKVSMLVSPSGDSDKENWSPDEEGNPRLGAARRTVPVAMAGAKAAAGRTDRVLQEQPTRHLLTAGSRANTAPSLAQRSPVKGGKNEIRIYEDGRVFDKEVEKFMRGEVSPSKKGDADCVAGLLALSQGNWR
jgi:hypothetical protein